MSHTLTYSLLVQSIATTVHQQQDSIRAVRLLLNFLLEQGYSLYAFRSTATEYPKIWSEII